MITYHRVCWFFMRHLTRSFLSSSIFKYYAFLPRLQFYNCLSSFHPRQFQSILFHMDSQLLILPPISSTPLPVYRQTQLPTQKKKKTKNKKTLASQFDTNFLDPQDFLPFRLTHHQHLQRFYLSDDMSFQVPKSYRQFSRTVLIYKLSGFIFASAEMLLPPTNAP